MLRCAKTDSFLLGFTALSLQIILMREIFVVFYGNELGFGFFLGVWMCWFAFGAWLGNFKICNVPQINFGLMQILTFVAVFISMFFLKFVRTVFNIPYGELFSFSELLGAILLILLVPCSLLGIQFSFLAKQMKNVKNASAKVYILESYGSVLASLVVTFLLVRYFSNLQAVAIIFFIVMVAVFCIQKKNIKNLALLTFLLGVVFYSFSNIDFQLAKYYWRSVDNNFNLLAIKNSKFGQTAIIESNGEKVAYYNGIKQTALPDLRAAQSLAALVVTQHPLPEKILYIGNGLSGVTNELTNYPGITIDHVDLDEIFYNFAVNYYPDNFKMFFDSNNVNNFFMDGRRFLLDVAGKKYDIIAVNVGPPSSSLSNRYYTKEFFELAKNGLKTNGLLAILNFPSAENYMGPELLELNKTLFNTLELVFDYILFVPGDNAHYFASSTPVLATNATMAKQRYSNANSTFQFFHPSMFNYVLGPFRINQGMEQLLSHPGTLINLDKKPVCYFYDFLYWNKIFRGPNFFFQSIFKIPKRGVLIFLTGITLLWIMTAVVLVKRNKSPVLFGLTYIVGFISISLNITLLLIFQTAFGYIYEWLGLALAAFMLGLGLGAWSIDLFEKQKNTIVLNLIFIVLLFTLMCFIPLIKIIQQQHSIILFYILSFWCGGITGSAFPVLNRIHTFKNREKNVGAIYAWDLLGGAMGSMLITGLFIPLFGFEFPLHICILVLFGGLLLFNLTVLRISN